MKIRKDIFKIKSNQSNIKELYHKLKDETFYLQEGKLLVKYSDENNIDEAKEFIMQKGDKFHVPTGLKHQMFALKDTELFEFSTQHFDSDSNRIERGD